MQQNTLATSGRIYKELVTQIWSSLNTDWPDFYMLHRTKLLYKVYLELRSLFSTLCLNNFHEFSE